MNDAELKRIGALLKQLATNPPPEVKASLRKRMERVRRDMPKGGDYSWRATR